MYQANNNIEFLMLMKTSYKLKEAAPFEYAHMSTHFALFFSITHTSFVQNGVGGSFGSGGTGGCTMCTPPNLSF